MARGSRKAAPCACAAPGPGAPEDAVAKGVADAPRRAVAVDDAVRAANLRRLRRIEGQVRGLQKMVEEERYCADILVQLSSVQEALRAVGRELLRNHLKHCAADALRAGEAEAAAMVDELVALMHAHGR